MKTAPPSPDKHTHFNLNHFPGTPGLTLLDLSLDWGTLRSANQHPGRQTKSPRLKRSLAHGSLAVKKL